MSPRHKLTNIVGRDIEIPVSPEQDNAYFIPSERNEIKQYYDDFGYVAVRNAIPHSLLDAANAAFDSEVLPSEKFIYRQATANPERHVRTEHGFMLNSIVNPQSVNPYRYGNFRNASVDVLVSDGLQRAAEVVLEERGKIVQGMYFHGNPATWPHQDSYYLDSEYLGAMTAAWIAAEDIMPGAGRFFIYPKSHKIPLKRHNSDINIATNHDKYKKHVIDMLSTSNLECRAPALAKGDILFWNAFTIHGSLPTTQPAHSRRSFTAHLIPESHRFLQYQTRISGLTYETVGNATIARPKDQASVQNRAIMFVETTFPKTFQVVKKTAIRLQVDLTGSFCTKRFERN